MSVISDNLTLEIDTVNGSDSWIGMGLGVVAIAAAVYFGPDMLEEGFKKELRKESRKVRVSTMDYESHMAELREQHDEQVRKMYEAFERDMMNFHGTPMK